MISIRTNVASLNVQSQLAQTQRKLQEATTRISTGLRINSAKDDAAGLAISTSMESQIRGMTVASRNVNEGVSMLQVAEGAYNSATSILQKMRELTVSAQQGTLSTEDLSKIDAEYQSLSGALSDNFKNISFNGKKILGADAGDFVLQVGANAGDTFTVKTTDASTLLTAGTIDSAANAKTQMAAIDTALDTVSTSRTNYAASMTRLEHTYDNLQTSIINTSDARSKITDADYAVEISKLTSAQILQQAGTAMLAQANSAPNMVLSLLK